MDGTPLVKRLDFAFPTEAEALRQDQYLLLDSMLVAPVNPFVNGTKPWTEGQTGVDPKQPGSFNRTREVWIPPGEWEDAYSGATVTGPKVLSRAAVPLEQTVLYHRRPSIAVTARRKGRNAATTDVDDLVVEAFPSSGASGTQRTTRELWSSDGRVGATVELEEHAAGSAAAAAHCEGRDVDQAASMRLLTLRVTGDVSGSKTWTARLHLPPNQRLANVDTSAILAVVPPLEAGAAQAAPLGGQGARPSAQAGAVVEAALSGGEQQALRLCVL